MLRTYGRQVTTSRRLARYRRTLQAAGMEDEVRISREAKRRELVGRVTAEIVENCIVTGSDTPVVEEIKADLEEELGYPLLFAYPPEDQELQIFRLDAKNGPAEIIGEEKAVVFKRLWELALEKVDETML
jgi:alkanesulfonate monooxygenase SsuD/methylene tetrahydromethanopterin reductase-like flavin-dependent oxidoreductase (luciferase family)